MSGILQAIVDPSLPAPPLDPAAPPPGTVPPAAPAPPAPPLPGRVRLRWHPIWKVLGALLLLTVTAVGAGGIVRAPYVVYAPGSATSTQGAITIPGTETYEPDGDVLFLTVSLRGASRRLGYAEALWGWLRADQDVYPRDLILRGLTGQENREASVQEMALSQELAAKVALEHLGYEVATEGTGAVLGGLIADTPAAEVLQPFDVITAVDGEATPTDVELRALLAAHQPGDTVEVTFERGEADEEHTEPVEMIADPEDADRALLGVMQVFTRDLRYILPFPVQIDTDNVGGPSAGLALTLGILDVLTEGSLTGGHVVAVTGTIQPDGSVGEVGGVAQKTVAANGTDADLLIVPAAEAAQARRFAASDVEVVGVEDLDDALDALAAVGGNALELDTGGGR